MGWNYTKAVVKWTAAGMPLRTEQEITAVFAICQACPHFTNGDRPHCKLCGCSLSLSPDGLRNKIAMATESCPDSPARW